MKTTPTGMVPGEDTGVIMGAVTLPPGTSQERAAVILARVDSLVAADPAVSSRTLIAGFSFLGGQGPSYGSFIIKLKPWEERAMMQNSTIVFASLYMSERILRHITNTYRLIYQGNISIQDALIKIEEQIPMSEEIENIIQFIKNSKGIVWQ